MEVTTPPATPSPNPTLKSPAAKPMPKPAPLAAKTDAASKTALPAATASLAPPSLPNESGVIDPDSEQEQPPVHIPGGFFAQPWVQNILPLATSLVVHIAIIVIGLAFFVVIPKVVNPHKEQVIIPEAKAVAKDKVPGGIKHPGLAGDKSRDAAQDLLKDVKDPKFNDTPQSNLASLAGGGDSGDAGGMLGSSAGGGHGHSVGQGIGDALGSGTGGGAAQFGVPGGGDGMGPPSNFMGTGGNAKKVIFLCDASGSMMGVFGSLKRNLKESINQLDAVAEQQFNVIFFYDDQVQPLFKDGMHIASAENKHIAMDFIDNDAVAHGGTQPMPAIKFTLAEKPELLYVLTDGFDNVANFDDVVKAFKNGNDGSMHINTIYLQSDNKDEKLVEVLKQIAKDGNGEYKPVLESDMN